MEIGLNIFPWGILSLVILGLFMIIGLMLNSLHPLVLTILVVFISGAMATMMSSLVSLWALLALMLIFLGGMMVIFSYLTSLASNDKLTIDLMKNPLFLVTLVVAASTSPSLFTQPHFMGTIYTLGGGGMLLFLTAYLLLTLLAVVKLVQYHKGALASYQC